MTGRLKRMRNGFLKLAISVPMVCVLLMLATTMVTSTGMAAAGAASLPEMRAPVVSLYKMFACEALSSNRTCGWGVAWQSTATLRRFFEPSLTSLLVQDAACQRKLHEVCNLDFDILFDSQDPRVTDLRIAAVNAGEVAVNFKDPVTGSVTHIKYLVRPGDPGWRIDR